MSFGSILDSQSAVHRDSSCPSFFGLALRKRCD